MTSQRRLLPVLALACACLGAAPAAASDPLGELRDWLATPVGDRPRLDGLPFAAEPLTRAQAAEARQLLWEDHGAHVRATRQKEWDDQSITLDGKTLKWKHRHFGTKPKGGWNLYLSLHGGGGAPARVNDRQWENQVRLYQPKDALYIAPRAPTDNWNLWHEPHVDALFARLIEDAIVLGDVNPNRVYVMGYSAGGDGVYQLAPRMADRWAAAAMMAGHPNDASPLGLRNIGFTLHVGADDSAYKRNAVAAEWKRKLADLRAADPEGYEHEVQIHQGRGHWMNLEDKVALGWGAVHARPAGAQGGVAPEPRDPRPLLLACHAGRATQSRAARRRESRRARDSARQSGGGPFGHPSPDRSNVGPRPPPGRLPRRKDPVRRQGHSHDPIPSLHPRRPRRSVSDVRKFRHRLRLEIGRPLHPA